MAFESLTDEFIEALISCPKKVINPRAREVLKPGHKQVNYIVHALDESGHEFQLFIRQNLAAGMDDDFSCGLLWDAPNGETLTLCRYNGASHIHRNKIEDKTLNLKFHIHRSTKKYIAANQNPDGFAYETDRYQTIDEALICLISDCNVDGLGVNPGNNQLDLFK